jgi:uncharacterized protein YacL
MSTPFEETGGEKIKPEAREYNTRALTFGGLTFASIALLFDAFRQSLNVVTDVLLLLVLSLGFFFLSYSVEVLVRQKRIFWLVQDKSLNFGYLGIVFALLILMTRIVPVAFIVLWPFISVILVIHFWEYGLDLTNWKKREQSINK